MGVFLSAYQETIAEFEKDIAPHLEKYDDKYRNFMLMVAEYRKSELNLHVIRRLGPQIVREAFKNLDPDFTFDDYIAGADRLFDRWK